MKKIHNITKCICFDMSFSQMKKTMNDRNIRSIEEFRKIKPVATNCKLCLPYINKMIETGKTEFEIIIE